MAKLKDIEQFINNYLKIGDFFDDTAVNGLNVKGKSEVKKIALGVSPNLELFEKAVKWNADMIITHHAILRKDVLVNEIGDIIKNRIEFLKKRSVSLLCYHLPLDFHQEVGNNILLLKKLGADFKYRAGEYNNFKGIFFIGCFSNGISRIRLVKEIEKILKRKPEICLFGKKNIKTIAVTSGGGSSLSFLMQLSKEKVDLYLTGEISEYTPSAVKEMKFNYVAGGHYATEVFGIQALGERLEKEFKIKTKFISVRAPY
ncbi:MAG: Nif3-like dinuclear metal center hexameric protein [Candidatus Portnoybacteria bacterium]|nr:Nif3-like dinuclear metal center hexameric protein [Candidatus Portnoybacteria bacterium]